MLEEALRRIKEAKETNATELDLSGYLEENIPKELLSLSNLTSLNISYSNITKLENIESLTKLTDLNLSNTAIEKLENLSTLTKLTHLNLSYTGIRKLENLENLISLTHLDLRGAKIKKLENLESLTRLSKLDLGYTDISKLENLNNLTALTDLCLRGTRIRKLENLDSLTKLTHIDLCYTSVIKLENLDRLTSLTHLNLHESAINRIENLDCLTKLVYLNLSSNKITKIEGLYNLLSLRYLNLGGNEISDIENLDALTELTHLDLGANKISNINNLDSLTKLIHLDLGANKISNINNLDSLIELVHLDLSYMNITQIENVNHLTKLNHVDLSFTKVLSLRPILFLIRKGLIVQLKKSESSKNNHIIYVEGSTITTPPLEIIKQGNQAILNYFDAIENGELIYLYEAKMLLLGQGGVGKTSLLEKLQDRNNPLPQEEETTKGIDIAPYYFKDAEGKQYTVNIWDFGGQEIYKATHQFFLTKRSLYILVDSTRSNEIQVNDVHFNKWFQVAKLYGGNSPLLIFKNKIAGRDKDINLKSIRARYDFVKEEFASDLKYPCKGLDDFEAEVRHQIQKLPHIGTPLPKNWVELRNKLLELSKTTPCLPESKFYDYCKEYGIKERQQQKEISALLHSLGAFLHFQENALLKKTIFLQNEWATNAVYKILDDEKIVRQKGHFTKEDLQLIWDKAGYEDMQGEFLELMKSFELCYALDDTNTHFLAPQLLSMAEPEHLKWDNERECLQSRYKYDFLPYGLFSRFIVRSHRYLKDTSQCWKQGVVLEYESSKALVKETFQQNEIHIKVYGIESKELMTRLIEKFEDLHKKYEGIKEDKYIPCNCKDCLDGDPTFYEYKDLKRRIEKKRETVECKKSYAHVNVLRLLDNIYDKLPKEIEHLQKKHKKEEEGIFSDETGYKEYRPVINVNIDNKPSITQTVGDTTSVNVGGEKNTVVTASEKVKTEAPPMEQKTPQAKAWYQSWWVGRIVGALGAGIVLALGALLFGYRAYFLEVFYVVFCVVAALLLYKGDPKKRFYRAAKRSFVAALFAAAFDIGLDLEFYEKMDDGYLKTAFQFGSQFSWLFFIGFIIGAIALFYMDYRKDKDS